MPMYRMLADGVLLLHFLVVVFVVGGLVLVLLGHGRGWAWVRWLPFRVAHLAAIGVVATQAWLGAVCPLTTLESWLRAQGGEAGYSAGFIEHWLHRMLFFEAPLWVFTLAYTVFGLLVVAAWCLCPPGLGRRHQGHGSGHDYTGDGDGDDDGGGG